MIFNFTLQLQVYNTVKICFIFILQLHMWKKRLETVSDSKEMVPDGIGDEWDIEITKERLEIGISLLDQLQLVNDGRKA